MSFLYPAFLLGALAVALPIVLHLLRRDVAPEVPFSAVRLLRKSPIDRTRRRRLRDLILLAARVAALTLLAMAFARPYLTRASGDTRLRIVAVDRSFSMGAPGVFARAVQLAETVVDEAGLAERVAVIAFDDRADVVAAPGAAGDARAALAALRVGDGATRFAPAVAKAIEVAAGSPARVVLISDLQRNGWEDEQPIAIPSALQIDVRDIGPSPPNVAILQVRAEPQRVIASVRNTAAAQFTGTARVKVDGREVASAAMSVPPDETADVVISYSPAARGALAVSIDDRDGFQADNTRYVVLDPPDRTRVLILTAAGAPQSGLYVARALEAASSADERAFDLRSLSGTELSALSPGDAARNAAMVVLSTRGLDRRGRDLLATFVRGGGGLLLAAGPDLDASVLASALGWNHLGIVDQPDGQPLRFSASDIRHPVFRPFGPLAANLGQVRFERIWKLRPEGWEVAARFDDGSAALIERQEGRGRAMVFASDLDRRWNEFPLHPAFVPFIAESVRHVAGSTAPGHEYLVADAPIGTGPAAGVYTAKDGRRVAVNVDVRESATARLTPREFADMLARPQAAAASISGHEAQRAQRLEGRQSLWQYGLVLMLVVLAVESAVGRT